MSRATALLLSLLLATGGCRASFAPLLGGGGGSPARVAELRVGADQAFVALAGRYGTLQRDARYAYARQRIGQMALIPSRAFGDSAVWTVRPTAGVRILLGHGEVVANSYRFRPVAAPIPLDQLGDARHRVVLTHLGGDEYRWDTSVDYAIGSIGAHPAAAVVGAFLASADARGERPGAADYRSAFPRTAAVGGQLFSVDTLRTLPLRDGSTAVTLAMSLHPERVRARWPALAGYLEKYVSPARWRSTIRDGSGAAWMVGRAGDGRMWLQFRTQEGKLLPFSGAARPMPDTLDVELDFSVKVGLFRVGFDALHMQLARIDTPREVSWEFISRREPEWRLPPLAERLIRTPLRRPFMEEGSHFRIGFRDEGSQTLLARYVRLPVQESAILRFIGRLGATAFGDISDAVEQQEAQFLRALFLAMRADLGALAP